MLWRKENVDKNLDPDAEWPLICHMCSNTEQSSCHTLSYKVSHVLFR